MIFFSASGSAGVATRSFAGAVEATGAGSQAFGGDGNDLVILSNAAAVSQINSNDLLIDAGSGFDTLLLAAGGAGIDLTLVNQNTLQSIEKIKTDTAVQVLHPHAATQARWT